MADAVRSSRRALVLALGGLLHRVDTDVQGRQVTSSQFGHLMQLILDARR